MKEADVPGFVNDLLESCGPHSLRRRQFLRLGTGFGVAAAVSSFSSLLRAAPPYRVGVGGSSDPYDATMRAIQASEEWPALGIVGKVVVIKPNLVLGTSPETGTVTDPEVVRAVIDKALGSGAVHVLIVETARTKANFLPCGYGYLDGYRNKVTLVDMKTLPQGLNPVPGWVYKSFYSPTQLLSRDVVFINVAKLKTHWEVGATLSTKNLFAFPDINSYPTDDPIGQLAPRYALHSRGVHQAILDVNLLRPSDFVVLDGIVGMEGPGPFLGTPVRMDVVLAGRNTIAVDRVALAVMQMPPARVSYLAYAAAFGLGPSQLSQITVAGDALPTRAFVPPPLPPAIRLPRVAPGTFAPGQGQSVTITARIDQACTRTVEVIRFFEDRPDEELIRTIAGAAPVDPGVEQFSWDGRADDGSVAPPGRYAVRVRAIDPASIQLYSVATAWVGVSG